MTQVLTNGIDERALGSRGAAGASLVIRFEPIPVSKLWGRAEPSGWDCGLPFGGLQFGPEGDRRIGEVHHRLPAGAAGDVTEPLLLKTLYAETMLSVQVHPDAAMAARLGLARGKDEAWLILEARPGARVGLGLREAMSAEALRAAVEDGSIVEAMVWHEVRAGDALMVPAGTVHAIGAGMTMFEVQQNMDVTYRLHDHGRGRRLDVEQGLAVARREAWTAPAAVAPAGPGRDTLVSGGGFVMERVAGAGRLAPEAGRPVWVAAVAGEAVVGGVTVPQGFVALVRGAVEVAGAVQLLLAQPGAVPQAGLWMPLEGG
jgi:mannose-6-phosphate isomerase